MGGMDFSNLDKIKKNSNENVERVSGEVVTISNTLPESVSMGATGGAVAILPIIDKAINLLDTGLRCYAMVQHAADLILCGLELALYPELSFEEVSALL